MGFSDCHNAGFYQYDANGERTYKLTGGFVAQNVQGQWWSYNVLDNPTLYTSPYLVATPKGYTKHYYAESERVASRIGGGGLNDVAKVVPNIDDILNDVWVSEAIVIGNEEQPLFYENKKSISHDHLTDVMMCVGTNHLIEEKRLCDLRYIWRYILDTVEPNCYWYHPDHLGSSSWITYSDGSAVQHLHYLPWGEDFVDQRTTNWNAPFTFSAKERDSETGLSYFGSRYYSSDLSIWLSVDPQASKYPSLSPYVYCANNPVKLVDPNGEEYDVFITGGGAEWITQQLSDSYQKLNITRDEFGRLHTDVEDLSSLTKDEKLIYDAINATDVVVNIAVGNDDHISTGTNVGNFILDRTSGFAGNVLSDDKTMAFTCQLINKSKVIANYYAKDRGKLVAHELTESYLGGKYSLEKQCLAPPAVWVGEQNPYYFNKHYRFAHDNATIQPYNKQEIRNMFCQGFSWSGIVYDLFFEKALGY